MENIEKFALAASVLFVVLGVGAWASGYPALTTVSALFVVAILTFFFNSVMQRRAWKREVAVKMTQDLYGPLYVEVGKILQAALSSSAPSFVEFSASEWSTIRADYRLRVLGEELRRQVDDFYALVETVRETSAQVRVIAESALLRSLRKAYGSDVQMASWTIVGYAGEIYQGNAYVDVNEAIIKGLLPRNQALASNAKLTRCDITLGLVVRGTTGSQKTIGPDEEREIFEAPIAEVREDPKRKSLEADRQDLLNYGEKLRERLGAIVEAPWKF